MTETEGPKFGKAHVASLLCVECRHAMELEAALTFCANPSCNKYQVRYRIPTLMLEEITDGKTDH